MQNTTNYNLKKPESTDNVLITDINGNMETIDAQMKENSNGITVLNGNLTDLETTVNEHKTKIATQTQFGHVKGSASILVAVDGTLSATPASIGADQAGAASSAQSLAETYSNGIFADLAGPGRTTETVKGNADVLVTHLVTDATETTKGHVELATPTEITAGTDGTKAVTPLGLKSATDLLIPTSQKGVPGGLATLGADGKLALDQRPDVFPPNNATGMTAIVGKNAIGLIWNDPNDTVLGDNTIVKWAGTKILMKTGSYPADENDGILVVDSKVRDWYYIGNYYTVTGLTAGVTYYFRAFPYSDQGVVNRNSTAGAEVTGIPIAQFQQTFTSTGTYTIPPGVTALDAFLVGGGQSGVNCSNSSSYYARCAGGGGGYTKTYKAASTGYKDGGAITVVPGQTATIIVGSGGAGTGVQSGDSGSAGGNAGGATSIAVNGNTYVASGASGMNGTFGGGNGGSGGGSGDSGSGNGASGGYDGANGGTGTSGTYPGGTGQGHTTRAFGESTGSYYAGGGGGTTYGNGGPGGGGAAATSATTSGTAGQANTGGGGGAGGHSYSYPPGAGGSGVVIIRWGY